jgi:hypothetical protein
MKTESGTQPKPYRITAIGNDAHIEFAENVQVVKTDDGTKYVYDSHVITVRNTANLDERVSKNLASWLAKAKGGVAVKVDPLQEKISLLEARLAKVEAVPLVKTALEPVIKEPTLSK